MKKIGLYGGSFNPIHFGHLNLAIELFEKCHLDEIWFIPVQVNPLKQNLPLVSFEDRSEMLKLAIHDIPSFRVCEIEKHLPIPSYTLNTLNAIELELNKDQSRQFFFLLGEDALPHFCDWHKPEEIVKRVGLLIGSRTGTYHVSTQHQDIEKAIAKGLVKTHLMDISATEIRNRISQGKYCGHLIPHKVLDYIYIHKLYR